MNADVILTLGLAIIGVVEAIKKVSSLNGIYTILLAGFLGLFAGIAGMYLHWALYAGLDPLTGLMIGLAGAGGVTLVKKIGQ